MRVHGASRCILPRRLRHVRLHGACEASRGSSLGTSSPRRRPTRPTQSTLAASVSSHSRSTSMSNCRRVTTVSNCFLQGSRWRAERWRSRRRRATGRRHCAGEAGGGELPCSCTACARIATGASAISPISRRSPNNGAQKARMSSASTRCTRSSPTIPHRQARTVHRAGCSSTSSISMSRRSLNSSVAPKRASVWRAASSRPSSLHCGHRRSSITKG